MRWICSAALLFSLHATGDLCLPGPDAAELLETIHEPPCYGDTRCLEQRLEELDQALEMAPDEVLLHRVRQDLLLATDASSRELLAAEYRALPQLDSPARDYLVARVLQDADGLREAAERFAWARLDLLQRQWDLDGQPLAAEDEREALMVAFFAECPDAMPLMLKQPAPLAIRLGWPVWGEIRRHLLAMDSPPWEQLDGMLIQGELMTEQGDEDPAAVLLAEAEAIAGDHEDEAAGYWLYRARIHFLAKDPQAALAANKRVREIDPCRQVSPMQRQSSTESGDWDPEFFAEISEEILNCPPDFERYQYWLLVAGYLSEQIPPEALKRVRTPIEQRVFGIRSASLERSLANLDIIIDHEAGAAWATLERLFADAENQLEQATSTREQAGLAEAVISIALGHAHLGFTEGHTEQGRYWRERADRLLKVHKAALDQVGFLQEMVERLHAARAELAWLEARHDGHYADAVIHALNARAEGHPWIDMDEVAGIWRKAGGSDAGFEQLLAAWNLELPAIWRGWRRLGEPLEDFELADQKGRTWTIAELDGKRTLVNVWAVWCGPCLEELPKVQEVHELFRDDPGVQVVTINLDPTEGMPRRLMAREGYDFPVLFHGQEDSAFSRLGIPRNWLVDGDGIRQWEQTGFNFEIAEHWVEDISSLLEMLD